MVRSMGYIKRDHFQRQIWAIDRRRPQLFGGRGSEKTVILTEAQLFYMYSFIEWTGRKVLGR